MSEKVLIIGAGIAGLSAALALQAKGFAVTLVDRDAPLPDHVTPEDSWSWPRRGAPQVRHPHFLMGRLRNLLQSNHPRLVCELLDAGVWELPFEETLHPAVRPIFDYQDGDEELTPLCARRTTLELVMRRYVVEKGIADLRCDSQVTSLVLDNGAPKSVLGANISTNGNRETAYADIVIDASGRGSKIANQLRQAGAVIDDEQFVSGNIYYTRHFKLKNGRSFPVMAGLPAAEFADFTIGALPADNGTFTVTISVWKDDPILFENREKA